MDLRSRIVVGIVAVAELSAQAAPAFAQSSDGPKDPVDARFDEGMAAIRSGDYESALRAFAAAYAIRPMPRLLFDLALCEEKTGRWLDALKHYKAVIEESTTAEQDRADARRHVNALEAKVGHLKVRAPATAGIALDGGPIVATAPLPEPLAVPPGRHVVSIYLPAGVQSASVEAPAGQDVVLDFAAATTADSGAPRTAATPSPSDAERPRGSGAATPVARIVVSASLAAVGLAAIGSGAYFGEASRSDAETASHWRAIIPYGSCHPPVAAANAGSCSALSTAVDDQNRDAILSYVLYATGGVIAAGAVATWFFWPRPKARANATLVMPSFDPHGFNVDVIAFF